jgi:hypothetical protein
MHDAMTILLLDGSKEPKAIAHHNQNAIAL